MIEHSVDFNSKFLNNCAVIGRCFAILELGLSRKLGFEEYVEIEGLYIQLARAMLAFLISDISKTTGDKPNYHIELSELGNSLLSQDKRIVVTAYVQDEKCTHVTCEVVDDIIQYRRVYPE